MSLVRPAIQWGFTLLVVWIGVEFFLFVRHMETGAGPFVPRPQGVDAFLPISALISLKYWVLTGIYNHIHPAGLVIFMAIIANALLLKRSFCSWICPVGLLSELHWKLGKKLAGGNLRLPRLLDYPLRSLKYLLLAFFLWGVLVKMDAAALKLFIYSPYNRVAEVKMLKFFADISPFALKVILALSLLSLIIKNFWCRYLCPYGALVGALSLVSPVKIRRNESACSACGKCAQVCPTSIRVDEVRVVRSDECTACLDCVVACPLPEALQVRPPAVKKGWTVAGFAAAMLLLFAGFWGAATLTGNWQNGISDAEYKHRIRDLDNPIYGHARGDVPEYLGKDPWIDGSPESTPKAKE